MKRPASLLISLKSVKKDPALRPKGRGARKLVVTRLIKGKEFPAKSRIWKPPLKSGEPCPVLSLKKTEIGVFNQYARQEWHYHAKGIEIYEVIEGRMVVKAEGKLTRMGKGDIFVINPGTKHKIMQGKQRFLCRVICLQCNGPKDKLLCKAQ